MIKEQLLKAGNRKLYGILRGIKDNSIDVDTIERGLLNIEVQFNEESIDFLTSNMNREILFICTYFYHYDSGERVRIIATDIISNEL